MLLEADLPDDPDALRAIIAGQAEAQRRLTDQVAALEAAGTEADAEIARLNAIIAAFQRHRFGARSEQLDEDQLQLALEEIGAAL
ncbi:transposase, partial [Pacificimonas flava]